MPHVLRITAAYIALVSPVQVIGAATCYTAPQCYAQTLCLCLAPHESSAERYSTHVRAFTLDCWCELSLLQRVLLLYAADHGLLLARFNSISMPCRLCLRKHSLAMRYILLLLLLLWLLLLLVLLIRDLLLQPSVLQAAFQSQHKHDEISLSRAAECQLL